jgi:hypothetical protein
MEMLSHWARLLQGRGCARGGGKKQEWRTIWGYPPNFRNDYIIPSNGTKNCRTDAKGSVGATDAREADKAAGVN